MGVALSKSDQRSPTVSSTKYVSRDETAFAQELYMDFPQMRQMSSAGMEIGGHGYKHFWLGQLSCQDQTQEIRRTMSFLSTLLGYRPSRNGRCAIPSEVITRKPSDCFRKWIARSD